MDVRRVVTGHDASGKSVFVSDEAVAPLPTTPFIFRLESTCTFASATEDASGGADADEWFATEGSVSADRC